jgi:RES domain-containing protein
MAKRELPFLTIHQSFWRLMAPKWSYAPLSGAGSAVYGGRFNRRGQDALYTSSDLETALAEYGQDLPDRPGTFCRYDVLIDQIADLRDREKCAVFDVARGVLDCPWKKILLIDGLDPPTWPVVDRLLDLDAVGALVPSQRRTAGYNLVLWQWDANKVKPFDPNNDLPLPHNH